MHCCLQQQLEREWDSGNSMADIMHKVVFTAVTGIAVILGVPAGVAIAKPSSVVKKDAMPDGKLQIVERRGRFVIKPDTLFCRAAVVDPKLKKILGPSYDGPNLDGSSVRAHLKKLQQSDYLNGSSRAGRSQAGKNCPNNGINIFVTGQTSLNAAGKPYRLELEARQGRSTVLKIEIIRANGLRPDWMAGQELPLPHPPGTKATPEYTAKFYRYIQEQSLQVSIRKDSDELSAKTVAIIFEGE
jgi:hypothetical protein